MSDLPLVSIIIPCHNAERWLRATLASALAQTWRHTEIILVDDGSKDRSLEIARAYESRGVLVIAQANAGASAARNAGLRLAQGDFIQYLDADDLLAPDKIERQLALPAARDQSVILSGRWSRFYADKVTTISAAEPLCADFGPVDYLISKLTLHAMMHPAAWLLPRALADRAGYWDERLSLDDDGEYFTRVVLASNAVHYCAEAFSYYRSGLHASLSQTKSDRAWSSQFLSVKLSVEHLLKFEDSRRTRRAGADAWQRLVFESYPAAPVWRAQARAAVAALGGSDLAYDAGPRFKMAARLLGWRLAKRLRNHLHSH